jgi:hypothetical protein
MAFFKKKCPVLDPREDPYSIGNLAISKGYATQEQVSEALRKQETRLPLGVIMLEGGMITEAQLENLLNEQEIARRRMSNKEAIKFLKLKKKKHSEEVSNELKLLAASMGHASRNL